MPGSNLSSRGGLDSGFVFLLGNVTWNRMADLFETGKIPQVRKVTALLWFHRLHSAVFSFEEDAFAVGFVDQCQAVSIGSETRVLLDEIKLAQAFMCGQPGNFRVRQTHLSRPATAGGTALALEKNRHS